MTLPKVSLVSESRERGPTWESAYPLVFPAQFPPRLVRWNVRTGQIDEYPLPRSAEFPPLPITGILDRDTGRGKGWT
ncbi:hypothetical protein [Actinokineospora pegani]|uniref:hypothetical protein n=1 Tax=Actinokineospora pegani TaxID=2654637 RepID=UPI0012EA2DD0|nr:hypothetical protein [Actinokineospora pegani]